MTGSDTVRQRAQRGLPALEAELSGSESVRRNTGAPSGVENALGRALRDEHQVALNLRQRCVQRFRCCDATRELQLQLGVFHVLERDLRIVETGLLTGQVAARVESGLGEPQLDQCVRDGRCLRS